MIHSWLQWQSYKWSHGPLIHLKPRSERHNFFRVRLLYSESANSRITFGNGANTPFTGNDFSWGLLMGTLPPYHGNITAARGKTQKREQLVRGSTGNAFCVEVLKILVLEIQIHCLLHCLYSRWSYMGNGN